MLYYLYYQSNFTDEEMAIYWIMCNLCAFVLRAIKLLCVSVHRFNYVIRSKKSPGAVSGITVNPQLFFYCIWEEMNQQSRVVHTCGQVFLHFCHFLLLLLLHFLHNILTFLLIKEETIRLQIAVMESKKAKRQDFININKQDCLLAFVSVYFKAKSHYHFRLN